MFLVDYLRDGVWRRDLRETPWYQRIGIAALRAVLHVWHDFQANMTTTRAAALTMTTLLALVPIVAMAFSVANGFGFGEQLDQTLVSFSQDLPGHLQDVVARIRELVSNIDFGGLGLTSSLIVLYTGMSLFVRTERALNVVWRAADQRSWFRRLSDFMALIILVPGLALGAVALNSVLASAKFAESWRENAAWLGWLYDAGLGFLPYLMISASMFSLYRFMPNTKVKWLPALVGGIVAGTALLLMNQLYIYFQIGVGQSNAVYATLAALPLFIAYVQVVWLIVLVGAQLSYSIQNADLLGAGRQRDTVLPILRERAAVALVDRVVQRFAEGDGGTDLSDAAITLDMPRRPVEELVADLERGQILTRAADETLLPSRPAERISIDDVRRAVRGELPEDRQNRLPLRGVLESAIDDAEVAHRDRLASARFG